VSEGGEGGRKQKQKGGGEKRMKRGMKGRVKSKCFTDSCVTS